MTSHDRESILLHCHVQAYLLHATRAMIFESYGPLEPADSSIDVKTTRELGANKWTDASGGRDETDQERTHGTSAPSECRNGQADSARHARLILLLADGLTWTETRAKLDCSDRYIDRWRKRFAADRLAGLFARYAGRERYQVTDRIEARVLAWTTKHKPGDGSTHWSSRKLAAELGHFSHMTVTRIWAKHGIKPHRLAGSLASNDPDFETKAAD